MMVVFYRYLLLMSMAANGSQVCGLCPTSTEGKQAHTWLLHVIRRPRSNLEGCDDHLRSDGIHLNIKAFLGNLLGERKSEGDDGTF
jgi:hypothetical protein